MDDPGYWGEYVPNWIVAATGALTLVAAIAAGIFAGRAAHWTRKQAEATDKQVEIATTELGIAVAEAKASRDDAAYQRASAEAALQRSEQARLDALLPTIYAEGRPAQPMAVEFARSIEGELDLWDWIDEPTEFGPDDQVKFRMSVRLDFTNLSDFPARIDVADPDFGEVEKLHQGIPFFLTAGETRTLYWRRVITQLALKDEQGIHSPEHTGFKLGFEVRDIGMNVRETYRFSGDLRYFSRDGSRLTADNKTLPWPDSVAAPVERVYERWAS